MPLHTVNQGECVSSIADQHGFFWKSVWEHPDNADLRRLRQDPNVLQEGDELWVPDKEPREEACATEARHKFRKKGVPAMLRIRVLIDDEPQSNARYTLVIDGRLRDGTTDADGMLEESIPPGAIDGELRVTKDGHERRFFLSLGHLCPIESDTGVTQRLRQLGYNVDADREGAIRKFQQQQGLDVTGAADEATRDKLKELYGQ